jgi:hypothetical protein
MAAFVDFDNICRRGGVQMKKVTLCLMLAAALLLSGFYGTADHAFAKVNEYEGQHR